MDKEIKPEDRQTTTDLDVIIKDNLRQFDIEQPDIPDNTPPAVPAPPPEDKKKTEEPPAAPPKRRFADHDKAEEGYAHAHAQNTRLAQENSDLKKQLGKYQTDESRIKAQSDMQEYEDLVFLRRSKMLDDIDALDPEMPNYKTEVAKLQAKADREIIEEGQKRFSKPSSAPQPPQEEAPVPPAAPDQPVPPDPDNDKVREYAVSVITKPEIGLKADDPLFWTYASQAPTHDDQGKQLSIDEQIVWAVEQRNKTLTPYLPKKDPQKEIEDAAAAAGAHQAAEQPLGRGGSQRTVPDNSGGADQKFSLADAIDSGLERRRL